MHVILACLTACAMLTAFSKFKVCSSCACTVRSLVVFLFGRWSRRGGRLWLEVSSYGKWFIIGGGLWWEGSFNRGTTVPGYAVAELEAVPVLEDDSSVDELEQ